MELRDRLARQAAGRRSVFLSGGCPARVAGGVYVVRSETSSWKLATSRCGRNVLIISFALSLARSGTLVFVSEKSRPSRRMQCSGQAGFWAGLNGAGPWFQMRASPQRRPSRAGDWPDGGPAHKEAPKAQTRTLRLAARQPRGSNPHPRTRTLPDLGTAGRRLGSEQVQHTHADKAAEHLHDTPQTWTTLLQPTISPTIIHSSTVDSISSIPSPLFHPPPPVQSLVNNPPLSRLSPGASVPPPNRNPSQIKLISLRTAFLSTTPCGAVPSGAVPG